MDFRMRHEQNQKLVLSPQMRQYLKLLQIPVADLEQAIEAEIAQNPVLEEPGAPSPGEDPGTAPEPLENPDDGPSLASEVRPGENFDHLDQLDDNFRDGLGYKDLSAPDSEESGAKHRYHETLITRPEVLSDFLLWQIRFLDLGKDDLLLAQEIVGNIDDDGYLRASAEEIALARGCSTEKILTLLKKIQELEPPGIAARSLQEALCLQLLKKIREIESSALAAAEHPGRKDAPLPFLALALRIVREQMPLLEKRDIPGLSRILGSPAEDIRRALGLIGRLEPRPGRTFYSPQALVVIPDASVGIDEEDPENLKIEIHTERIPKVRVSPYYRKLLRSKDLDEKAREFLKGKLASAFDFLKALTLRNSTLEEVTKAIAGSQREFFDKGFSHLKPLTLKDIGAKIGVHESTVSRAIQGKYMSTPQGLIPYKSFFSNRMEGFEGAEESQKSLMERIRGLIEKENPASPLSDQEIAGILKEEGVRLARRTVAKYRDLLRILPSHLRRKR